MPNLPMHIHLASRVAEQLDRPWINEHVGSLLLGSTAPDIRAMNKWPRVCTHFSELSVEEIGTGPRIMFQRHPEFADHDGLSHATRAFLVGYISHLVADEAWISQIYRPYFHAPSGKGSVAGTQVDAHIWDRALQLDMDRKALSEMNGLLGDGGALADADLGVAVGFLDSSALKEWREWVCRFLGWEFTWDRLKRALNRMYREDYDVQRSVEAFIQDMPGSLERVYEAIPLAEIAAYQQEALEETLAQVQEHWGLKQPR